jgi:hypothetical protein
VSYPGGKAGAGVYQTIINLMPPHELYVEPFVGGGAILLNKRPAPASIVIDDDADVAARWQRCAGQGLFAGVIAIHGDARAVMAELELDRPGTLIYADPPYVPSTLKGPQRYRKKFTEAQHRELLAYLTSLRHAAVMVSGYRCELYDKALAHWRRTDFKAMTRGGPAIESLWMNYAPPRELHDLSHVGLDFRQRERIKRKRARWLRRLKAMPDLERAIILSALLGLLASSSTARRDLAGEDLTAANDEVRDRARDLVASRKAARLQE